MCDLLFCWVNKLVTKGATQAQLQYGDLLSTPQDSTPKQCTYDLWNEWTKLCIKGRPSLLRAIMKAYGGPYFYLGVLKLINDGLTFAGAMLLNLLVKHLEQASAETANSNTNTNSINDSTYSSSSSSRNLYEPISTWYPQPGSPFWGFLLALLLGLSAVVKAVVGSHYNYRLSKTAIRLRGGMMGVLFRTALLTRSPDACGDVSTLMSVDSSRLANICVSVHELWSLPLQIVAAVWLLYVQVGTAFIAGVLLCIALVPVNRIIANKIQAASVELMSAKDSRLSLMSELLRHIGVVKALGWEQVMGGKIHAYREDELSALATRKYLDALCVYFWAATQLLLSGTTFGLMVLLGQPLQPSVVFTCLALFNVLIAPINAFPWVINGVVEAVVSMNRLQAYLLLPQRATAWAYAENVLPRMLTFQQQQQQQQLVVEQQQKGGRGVVGGRVKQHHHHQQQQQQGADQNSAWQLPLAAAAAGINHQLPPGVAAQFHAASFAWKKGSVPCLSNLQLSIPAGCLTAVVGEVGSGKSSLLAALLGELEITDGYALLPNRHMLFSGFSGSVPQGVGFSKIVIQQGFETNNQQGLSGLHNAGQAAAAAAAAGSSSSGGNVWRSKKVGYVSQHPWLMHGSVRDNILLGQDYDAEFMGEILHAVGLDQDVAAMPEGDLTAVGDGGNSLSGGQRMRVALARALYQQNTEVFLFDDILACLDSHVAQWVLRHTLFGGLLQGATVVMVTKHPMVIQAAQLVIGLEHGRVAYCGSAQGFADWKVGQAAQASAAAAAAAVNGGGWMPLVRAASPHPRSPHLPSSIPHHHYSPPHSPSTSPPKTSHQDTVNLTGNSTENFTENFLPSEDAAPSELLLAGGHGVWACHASLSPQLNVISEDDCSGVLGRSLSIGRSSSMGDSLETKSPHAAARSQQQQQQQDTMQVDGLRYVNNADMQQQQRSAGDAAAAAAARDDMQQQQPAVESAAAADFKAEDEQQQQQQYSDEECRAVGAVHWRVYVCYMKSVGILMCVAVITSLLMMQATRNGIDLWVTHSLSTPADAGNNSAEHSIEAADIAHTAAAAAAAAAGSSAAPGLRMLNEADAGTSAAAAGRSLESPLETMHKQQQQQQQYTYPMHSLYDDFVIFGSTRLSNSIITYLQTLHWQPATLSPEMRYFLQGLVIIAAVNTVATLARAFSFAAAGMAAARSMHERLLAAVLGAKMTFFDNNPTGRILNRFSSDTSMVDDSLPFILNILLANAVSLAGLLAVLLLGQPLLLLLLLPLAVAYRRIQLYYRSSARELRRLEAGGLSPVYMMFHDVAQGADTIRAAAAQKQFMKRFLHTMDPYQAACLNNAAAANWLSARLQLLAAVLLFTVAALAAAVAAAMVSSSNAIWVHYPDLEGQWPWHASVGYLNVMHSSSAIHGSSSSSNAFLGSSSFRVNLLGLALAYCLPIVQLLNSLLSSSAETEQEMVAVERVMAYLEDMTPEEQQQQQQRHGFRSSSTTVTDQQQQQQQTSISVAKLKRLQRQQWRQQRLSGQQQQQQDEEEDQLQPLLPQCEQRNHNDQVLLPAAGAAAAIEFVDVVLRYRPGAPAALKGVSFKVAAGQKLGICGRTGAGKSSITAALLRLRPIESGHIFVQGYDTSQISLRDLRSRFGVVPQHPVLFSGTLRDNLDPTGAATDEQLAAALQAVHMWATLCSIALQKGSLSHGTYLLARRAAGYNKRQYRAVSATAAAAAANAPGLMRSRSAAARSPTAAGSSSSSAAMRRTNSSHMSYNGAVSNSGLSRSQSVMQTVDSLATFLHVDDQPAPLHSDTMQAAAAAAAAEGITGSSSSQAAGVSSDFDANDVSFTPAALAEGAAAAIGAAAGRAAAVAAAAETPRSTDYSITTPTAAAASPSSRRSPFNSLAAAAGALLSLRRFSSRSTWDFPPVPMYPAESVLAMKVGGPDGIRLSAGQSQLICVARVLLRRAPLVLLDEATAAVDPATAQLIHQVLREELDVVAAASSSSSGAAGIVKPTVIQIAHELSAVMDYDNLLVMSSGRVVESGRPADLAAKEGSKFAAMLVQAGHQQQQQR